MPLLSVTNLKHHYGQDIVLDGVSLSLEAGERVGLVGRNGTGKSTLLKAIGGLLRQDSGTVSIQRGRRAAYLAQDPELDATETLRGAAESAFAEVHALHRELDEVFHAMDGSDGEELARLMRRQEDLERRVEAAGGYAIDHRIGAVLHGLGFVDAQFSIPVGGLSGGQRGRVALARVLLEEPDLLLLDEPTNHLDIDVRLWLESFLTGEFKGAVLMISHDRYLLDRVVSRIVEVEQGRLIEYPGNYAAFRELRAERRLTQQRAYDKQQTKFREQEAYIRKYKAGQRAKQARGREARLEREKLESTLERPMELRELSLDLPRAERTGELVAVVRGLCKRYTNDDGSPKVLFDGLDVTISRGERWGIIGPNGAGKSTLVACLLGETGSDAGKVSLGTNLRVGYFRQIDEGLDDERSIVEFLRVIVRRENPGQTLSEQQTRDLAGAFLFSGGEQDKAMNVLSGGERARVRLAGLLASAKNVLVLDEPTNHLDISSAERLEQALSPEGGFEGTLILISHDRALIDATCSHLIILDGQGGASVFHGNYADWQDHRQRRAAEAAPAREPTRARAATPEPTKTARSAEGKSRHSWMKLEQVEEKMQELEARLLGLDDRLGDPDVWKDPALAGQLTDQRDAVRGELDEFEHEWLRRMDGA